ncbi:hypothetical protein ACD591_17250 [Rufibacter glacialis]|uniref:Uncharacterized protein n=1 Tax=Rufibacter glacialis TaxID=1259555 RepID=A0A5M8QHC4_9BACT|nr:hypothetical protein [Rufibacter glacialis]KAA6434330.1 hypothetical protein FOE74_08985 [Rufibacter glacialis]GGK68622.1 hypothetical protein GCM10011405_15900 [Rufibacter glacialis]
MENTPWDADRYKELNIYFREKIQHLLSTDPHLQKQVSAGKSVQLEELVESMTLNDQLLWEEFLQLDQQKMHQDLQNHLEGKGDPLHDQSGFYRHAKNDQEDDENHLW